MLSENRKLVYAGKRYNDIHYRSLKYCFRIFPKDFDRLCIVFFVSFWSFFFFASLHIVKSRKKSIKITTIYLIYKPVEQTYFCVEVFQIIT